ncbi:MAG: FliH/SctL family protein [Candidatus Poribacteria bacterium]|nr:FliH/SctL family protein [Candidatus Poribacteria bacterium]
MKIRRRDANETADLQRYEYMRFARNHPSLGSEADEAHSERAANVPPPPSASQIAREEGFQEGNRVGHEQGLKEGYERGYQEASQEVEAQMTASLEEHFNSLLEALKQGAEAFTAEQEQARQQMELWIPRAALVIAEAVLRRQVDMDGDALIDVVNGAIDELPRSDKVRVLLSPTDYERLAEQPPDVWSTENLTFIADESVSVGGAVVQGQTNVIDARLESRLYDAAQHLLFPESADSGE